jgi:hypothetical protein
MKDPKRIAALARLAAVRKEADLSALAVASREVGRAEARIGALDAALVEARTAVAGSFDAASLAAQDAFARWAEGRRLHLFARLDEARRACKLCHRAAGQSFGRAEVLERLASEARGMRPGRTAAD